MGDARTVEGMEEKLRRPAYCDFCQFNVFNRPPSKVVKLQFFPSTKVSFIVSDEILVKRKILNNFLDEDFKDFFYFKFWGKNSRHFFDKLFWEFFLTICRPNL